MSNVRINNGSGVIMTDNNNTNYKRIVPAGMAINAQEFTLLANTLNELAQEKELTPYQVKQLDETDAQQFHYEACRRAGLMEHGFCIAV